jgi:uncharacterized protein
MRSSLERSCVLVLGLAAAGCDGVQLEKARRPGDLIDLKIGSKAIRAELASDEPSRAVGMMRRAPGSMPEDQGMLFIWPDRRERSRYRDNESGPQKRSFWMHDTQMPLSIAFISEDGKILQIEDMTPLDERKVWSKDEVRFALEMNQGWFGKNDIKPGAVFENFRDTAGRIPAH